MFDIYTDGLRELWAYQEFQIFFHALRYSFIVVLAFILFVVLLHSQFVTGRNSLLYRKRSPRPGWNKRFFPAALLLIATLLGLFWASGLWIASVS